MKLREARVGIYDVPRYIKILMGGWRWVGRYVAKKMDRGQLVLQ